MKIVNVISVSNSMHSLLGREKQALKMQNLNYYQLGFHVVRSWPAAHRQAAVFPCWKWMILYKTNICNQNEGKRVKLLFVFFFSQKRILFIYFLLFNNSFFLIWYYTCFNVILPNHPPPSLSHRVQKTVLYISVSFAVSHTGLLLPSF